MYKIVCDKNFSNLLPVLPFYFRYNLLTNNNGKKKVIYIKNEIDNSTFRYRCYNFIEALKDSSFDITYFTSSEIHNITNHISSIDIVILQRAAWDPEIANLIFCAKKENKVIVYDMDDLFYSVEHAKTYINHISLDYNVNNIWLYFGMASSYGEIAKKCDYFITTTDPLKENMFDDFNKKSYAINNFLNDEQIVESNYVVNNRIYDESKFVIGYFSGSASHKNDFRVVEKAIINLMKKYDNIFLKIVGFMTLDGELEKFEKDGRVIIKDFCPYQKLQYEIGTVDINLIPLVNNEFNSCKSELKFFESAIVKVPSCITPTSVYKQIINNNVNGVLCRTGDWEKNIEKMYLDKNFRNQIAENAYKTACQKYLPKLQTQKIEKVYYNILNDYYKNSPN